MNGIAQGSAGNGKRDNEGAGMMDNKHFIKKPVNLVDKIYKARYLSEHWLWLANMAEEKGNYELAKRHLQRGQKWLDELNVLEGYGNGAE